MNDDVESLLREGMERFTRDLRAPAGLTRRAAKRRRRRLAVRSIAGSASVLAAGAVALVAVVVPGAAENGTPAVASAYVVKRVDSALSAAEPGEIAQVMVTSRGAAGPGASFTTTTAEEWSYGDQWRSVSYSSAGQLVYDEGSSTSSVYTLVNYPTRTWARQRHLGRPIGLAQPGKAVIGDHPVGNRTVLRGARVLGPLGCAPTGGASRLLLQPGLPGIGFSASAPPTTAAKALRTAISCGIFAVAGRDRLDGNEAIELKNRPGSLISETIWVRPGTDLPIRVVVRSAPGEPAFRMTANITWLRPTTQNLAKLAVPIPTGFRRVPLAEAIGLTVLHMQGPLPKRICLPTGSGRTCRH
jgi:hypothetical protein